MTSKARMTHKRQRMAAKFGRRYYRHQPGMNAALHRMRYAFTDTATPEQRATAEFKAWHAGFVRQPDADLSPHA